eukprot:2639803-Heterocapsa_arctica.AAC.1
MYGLVAEHGPDRGKPIKRPWRIVYNKSSISDYLSKRCDRSHKHAPCSGQNTKGTEDNSPDVADAFHRCFRADVSSGLKACCACTSNVISAAPLFHRGTNIACPSLPSALRGEGEEDPMATYVIDDGSAGPRLGRDDIGRGPSPAQGMEMLEELSRQLERKGSITERFVTQVFRDRWSTALMTIRDRVMHTKMAVL